MFSTLFITTVALFGILAALYTMLIVTALSILRDRR